MNMTQLIEKGQAQRQTLEGERVTRQAREAEILEASKAADLADLRALMGEAADEMEIELTGWKVGNKGQVYDTVYRVSPKAWHGVVDFGAGRWLNGHPWVFKFCNRRGERISFLVGHHEWGQDDTLAMFAELQAAYEQARDNRIAVALEWLGGNTSELIADDAREILMTMAPERAEEWDAARAAWQQRRDARAAAVDAYAQSLAAWRAKYERTLAENRRVVARAQRALDGEFTRYEVAYAAVGDDADEPYRETAWSLEPDSDEDDYWSVFDSGNVVLRRLLRPLWVSEAITQTVSAAGEGPWRRAHYVHDAGVTVYYLPWGTVELHRQLDKTITPLPAEPEPPAFLSDGMTAAERERIVEVTRGMGRVDIPF